MKGVYTVKFHQILNLISLALLLVPSGSLLAAEGDANEADGQPVFATVGEVVVTQREYDVAYAQSARNRFYHGKPAEHEIAGFRQEVGDKLITEALLANEARRRKMAPDESWVKMELQELERRNAENPRWEKIREEVLPKYTQRLENISLREKLTKEVRKIATPSKKQLRKFYKSNSQLFTVPEQMRVSVILLKVDPSSTQETWRKAREFGKDLLKQIREGASFEEMAAKYSDDKETSQNGGDMGYLHGGMMSGLPEAIVKKLKPGEVSDVANLMEGVAIFKLTARNEAKLQSFESIESRVKELWEKDETERVWQLFIEKIKKNTPIKVEKSGYSHL